VSLRLFPDDVLFDQRLLACGGFYKGKLDGRYGPLTQKAEEDSEQACKALAIRYGTFDLRSERVLATLLPAMQSKARQIMALSKSFNLAVTLLSGTRTYAEQNYLFSKRPKVTNARGGQSNHNFGIAIDVGIFDRGHYLTGETASEEKAYVDLATLIKSRIKGVEWGGDWKSFKDQTHYQLATGKTLAQVRASFEAGKPFV